MPFRHATITTLVTPTLNSPASSKVPGVDASAEAAFWPRVGSEDFLFHLVAEDWDGQRCDFTAPLIFVGVQNLEGTEDAVAFTESAIQAVINEYDSPANESRRQRPMFGQKVAFAESSADKPGDTTLEAVTMIFGAELPASTLTQDSLFAANQPRFYPTVAQAQVRIPAVAQLSEDGSSTAIEIHPRYRNSGWDPVQNKGQVFIKLLGAKALEMAADKAGGVATPNLSIQGLSKQFGPVGGDLDQLAEGIFDPKEFFKDAAAKILGGVDLADIIPNDFGDGTNVPKITCTPVYPGNDTLALPEAIDTKLEWAPDVQEFGPYQPRSGAEFKLDVLLHTDLSTADSTYTINGLLTKFDVDMFGFIIVIFNSMKFKAASGEKTSVTPDIEDVAFGGPLEFINELKDFLNSGVLGDGLNIDISPTGVKAGYTLAIPEVAVGVLTIQNMSLSVALNIPFTGEAVRLRFAFCERENPFTLTVSMFGGGGFFGLALGLDGVELIEASFEFGASVAFDIGVASGGVYVMAGIYFKWEDTGTGGSAVLTGYLRLGGNLSVLGIITISLEFYMALTYASEGNKVWGEASLTVKIEILFFSTSVKMSVRREFADPDRITFASLMPSKELWDTYCEAFA